MASRWMNQMRNRERAFRRREGNSSLTEIEKRFYRPIIKISRDTGRIFYVESWDDHVERMRKEAGDERYRPREPHRIISRIQQVESIRALPLSEDERVLIRRKLVRDSKGRVYLDPQYTIHDVETSILRYRRLTGRSLNKAW